MRFLRARYVHSCIGKWRSVLIKPIPEGKKKWVYFVQIMSALMLLSVAMLATDKIPTYLLDKFMDLSTNYASIASAKLLRQLPLCTEGILDKKFTKPDNWNNQHLPLIQHNDCRLHFYTQSDFVTCVEALTKEDLKDRVAENNLTNSILLHVAFVGDSRIRHIFGNFILQLLPFPEDRCQKPTRDSDRDVCMETPLMHASFTYQRYPDYDEKYMQAISNWVEGKSIAPNYLVIGSAAHHVAPLHQEGRIKGTTFEGNITRLASLLNQLAERYGTRMVWWNDDVVPGTAEAPFIRPNNFVRQIFQENRVPIQTWDSTNDLFMGNIKTCELGFGRKAPVPDPLRFPSPLRFPVFSLPNSWFNCEDAIHAPQAYGIIQSQLITNDLCNRVMPK